MLTLSTKLHESHQFQDELSTDHEPTPNPSEEGGFA